MVAPPATRSVTLYSGLTEREIVVSQDATGLEIKQAALEAGLPMELSWQLQGHNRNGSNLVVGDSDVPWHDQFTVVTIYDNA